MNNRRPHDELQFFRLLLAAALIGALIGFVVKSCTDDTRSATIVNAEGGQATPAPPAPS